MLSMRCIAAKTSQTTSLLSWLLPCTRKSRCSYSPDYSNGLRLIPMTLTTTNTKLLKSSPRFVTNFLLHGWLLTENKMLSGLGEYFERKFDQLPAEASKGDFLNLMLQVVQSQSLMVSIPVLLSWAKMLGKKTIEDSDLISPFIGPLLEVCSARMIRYEHLPEDSEDPNFLFLLEDTDTIPERHAFLGNYRRYSSQVIEHIVQMKLNEAFSYILGQAEQVLEHLYDNSPPFSSES